MGTGIFGFATHKVYPSAMLPQRTVGSYPTFSPLPRMGRLFSAALAVLARGKAFPLGSMVLFVVPTFLPTLDGTIE